jgi:hypothetical protein
MAPPVRLRGLVKERPVPRLLVGVRGDELTGSVELTEPSGLASTIYLRRGMPVHVVRPDTADRLDQVLVEQGLVTTADIARAQVVRESSGLLMGQVLCQLGLVGEAQLTEMLQWQLKRKVVRLFSSEEGNFAITGADHPFGANPSSPGAAIDPRSLVFPGILASYSEAKLVAELGLLAGRLVRLRPASAAQLHELGFDHRHAAMLTHLRLAGFRLDESWIGGATGPRPREAKAILLALLYLDLLDYQGAPPRPVPLARVTPTPVVVAVAPPAPRTRPSAPLPALDPAQLYAFGQQSFAKGELQRAEEVFVAVTKVAPDHQRARAFLSWIAFWKKPESERSAAVDPTLKELRDVLRADETFAAGHYFVGALLKLRKDIAKAEQAFRVALMHDPALMDAQRELRLIVMRKSAR